MNLTSNIHSIAYRFSPESLRVAREYRGLKKSDLAFKLSITPSAITQFENGHIRPTAQTVAQLSMALGFPPAFFAETEGLRPISPDQCHFRSLRSCSQTERRKMVAAGSLIGKIVSYIDQHIELLEEQISFNTHYNAETTDEIEAAALELRRQWGLGLGPIDNMLHLLESKGVLVFRLLEESKRLDAFSLWQHKRPLIFLNVEKDSASRSRFDAAHELGHLVLHPDYLPGDPRQEDMANKFASAFLLPRESFIYECPRRLVWEHFRELKRRWKVSLAALARRARDLQLISDDTYKRANVQLNKRKWKFNEPDEPEMEYPTILPQAVKLFEQQGVTLTAQATALNIPEKDLAWLIYTEC